MKQHLRAFRDNAVSLWDMGGTPILNCQQRQEERRDFLRVLKLAFLLIAVVAVVLALAWPAAAAVETPGADTPSVEIPTVPSPTVGGGPGTQDPNINISINGSSSDAVRVLLLLTVLTVLPSILLMMTCFTRIIVVFSLLRNAIGLQQTPPNQVLIGLALFLSLFIMLPVINEVNETAYQPFSEGEISAEQFVERAQVPLKDFMLKQTLSDDLTLFEQISKIELPQDRTEYPMTVIIPAFITSELKRAFLYGFFLFIPFLIIDMVVSSALMSMGMMMLPPITISLPFKLMLFVLVDGWGLLIRALVMTYNVS